MPDEGDGAFNTSCIVYTQGSPSQENAALQHVAQRYGFRVFGFRV